MEVDGKVEPPNGEPNHFNWDDYFAATGTQPVPYEVFQHVVNAAITDAEHRVKIGDTITIHGSVEEATVLLICGVYLRLKYQLEESEPFWAHISQIRPKLGEKAFTGRTVESWFEPGQIFEYQDPILGADKTRLVAVETRHGCRLKLRECSSQSEACWWTDLSDAKLLEHKPNSDQTDSIFGQTRPEIGDHDLEVGSKLEMIDPIHQRTIVPATVTAVFNKKLFEVRPDVSLWMVPPMVGMDVDPAGGETSGTDTGVTAKMEIEYGPSRICHRGSEGLLPLHWANTNALNVAAPKGFSGGDFSWVKYRVLLSGNGRFLESHSSAFSLGSESHRFYRGRKLELVDPANPERMLSGTVTRTVKHLIWIHVDGDSNEAQPSLIYDIRSTHLFPCGWSSSVDLPLVPPRIRRMDEQKFKSLPLDATFQTERFMSSVFTPPSDSDKVYMRERFLPSREPWTPAIFVNCGCFSGPFLDAKRVMSLPKQYGLGPMAFVVRIMIGQLLSCSTKPKDALELIQFSGDRVSAALQATQSIIIQVKGRARNKKKCKGEIECCRHPEQLSDWLSQLLIQLDACPMLLSFESLADRPCPAECLTKLAAFPFSAPLKAYHPAGVKTRRMGRRLERRKPRHHHHPAAANTVGGGGPLSPRRLSLSHPMVTRPRKKKPLTTATTTTPLNRPVTRGVKIANYGQLRRRNSTSIRGTSTDTHRWGATADVSGGPTKVRPIATTKPQQRQQPARPITVELEKSTIPILSNPNQWSVRDLNEWLRNTDIDGVVLNKLICEEIDGAAFMLLSLQDCMTYLEMKLGPALKLCELIKDLKLKFLTVYAK